jgi:hypothetical protein
MTSTNIISESANKSSLLFRAHIVHSMACGGTCRASFVHHSCYFDDDWSLATILYTGSQYQGFCNSMQNYKLKRQNAPIL